MECGWHAPSGTFLSVLEKFGQECSCSILKTCSNEHMSDFMDHNSEIKKHGLKLPHWQQDDRMQSVTIRLADSLPAEKLNIWNEARKNWSNHHPKPWNLDTQQEYHQKFIVPFERWLDAGSGSCLFREAKNQEILETALMKFQDSKVSHQSWVIMPNHAHLLFIPLIPMEKLIQSWKGVSARFIGKGSIWQENYFDRMIRDGEHFCNLVRYIRRNPRKLKPGSFKLWEGERALKVV